MPIAPVPSRQELVDHLERTRIAGNVATPRDNNLDHYRRLADGDRYYWLGLELGDRWTDADAVLELMVERCGVIADREHRAGHDTISAELTVDALDRAAVTLRKAAESRSRVLLATGHPGGILPIHQATALALEAAGCEVLTVPTDLYADNGDIRQVGGVAMVHRGGNLVHTHSPDPMREILDARSRAGLEPPDLVFADHGWAGYAGRQGIDTIGFADCNDPALFVGEAEGSLLATVPLDDNVSSVHYAPLTAYLLDAAGLID